MKYRSIPRAVDKRIFKANSDAGFPLSSRGIVFWETEAVSVDAHNPSKAADYERAKLGNAVILSDDQFTRIISILSEGKQKRYDPELGTRKRDTHSRRYKYPKRYRHEYIDEDDEYDERDDERERERDDERERDEHVEKEEQNEPIEYKPEKPK